MENNRDELLKIETEIIEENIKRGAFDIVGEKVDVVSEHPSQKHSGSNVNNPIDFLLDEELNKSHKSIQEMKELADNHAFRAISSHRKFLGFIIILFKRIVRKLLKWYIDPICDQQTDFNVVAIDAIDSTNNSVKIVYQKNLETMSHVSDLVSEVEKLKDAYFNVVNVQAKQNEDFLNKYESFAPWATSQGILSSSENGEDVIVSYILKKIGVPFRNCTYLDINASGKNCFRISYFFYRYGARGVLIEEDPSLIQILKTERSGDVVLNSFITERSGNITKIDTFSKQNLSTSFFPTEKNYEESNNMEREKIVDLEGISISEIIKCYLHMFPPLLIINSENEKKNMDLLKCVHIENHRPLVVVITSVESIISTEKNRNSGITEYLSTLDYYEYAFTGSSSIYVDKNFIEDSNSYIL